MQHSQAKSRKGDLQRLPALIGPCGGHVAYALCELDRLRMRRVVHAKQCWHARDLCSTNTMTNASSRVGQAKEKIQAKWKLV